MNKEQQRIAIAEACGIKVIFNPAGPQDEPEAWKAGYFTPEAARQRRVWWPNSCVVKVIPNYLNDLNAMHEAEKVIITTGKWQEYKTWLWRVWSHTETIVEAVTKEIRGDDIIHATAAQRAEAFLKTIGKRQEQDGGAA